MTCFSPWTGPRTSAVTLAPFTSGEPSLASPAPPDGQHALELELLAGGHVAVIDLELLALFDFVLAATVGDDRVHGSSSRKEIKGWRLALLPIWESLSLAIARRVVDRCWTGEKAHFPVDKDELPGQDERPGVV